MGALVKDPIRVGGTFVHFLDEVAALRDLYLDFTVFIRGEGRTGQQLRQCAVGINVVLPALLICARVGILLDDKVCLGDIGDGHRCGLVCNHIHIMIAHIQRVSGMVIAAVLLHQVPAGGKTRKGIGGIVFILFGGAAADVVKAAVVQHLPQIDLPAQFHALTVGGCFSDRQISGPLGILRVDNAGGVIPGQIHGPACLTAGSIAVREYTFINIEC